jgi:putative holliday junction resolvase
MDEVLLGVDYGEVNTGLAFGRAGSVSPLKVVNSKNTPHLISEIGKVVISTKVSKIIVGLPTTLDGKETAQSLKVRQFTNLLKAKLKKPIEYVSEFATTSESIQGAIRSGISKKRRKTNDHLSAALILKRYYNEQETTQ